MRDIISISLPEELNRLIERMTKSGGYSTKSEFIRQIIRERAVEAGILKNIKISKEEISAIKKWK